jgi:hypothetical protein
VRAGAHTGGLPADDRGHASRRARVAPGSRRDAARGRPAAALRGRQRPPRGVRHRRRPALRRGHRRGRAGGRRARDRRVCVRRRLQALVREGVPRRDSCRRRREAGTALRDGRCGRGRPSAHLRGRVGRGPPAHRAALAARAQPADLPGRGGRRPLLRAGAPSRGRGDRAHGGRRPPEQRGGADGNARRQLRPRRQAVLFDNNVVFACVGADSDADDVELPPAHAFGRFPPGERTVAVELRAPVSGRPIACFVAGGLEGDEPGAFRLLVSPEELEGSRP